MDVWSIDLVREGELTQFLAVLDPRERNQAARFRFERDARRYIVAHAATRFILAAYSGKAPGALEFSLNAFGKPALVGSAAPVFSLSHSDDLALCAVAASGEIGVDIEGCRDFAFADMASRCFSEHELAVFAGLAPERKKAGFFTFWTLKEAYIKAKGLGLSLPLQEFSVDIGRHDESALLNCALLNCNYAPEDVSRYRLWKLAVADGYKAALAYAGDAAGPPVQREWVLPAWPAGGH